MKVSELIEKLQAIDPEKRVVFNGYEGGVCDVVDIEEVALNLDVNSEWYYGRHEICEAGHCSGVHIH